MAILTNNSIKLIKSLQQKKYRDKLGLFTVEGEKMLSEALSSGYDVTEIYRKEEIGEEAMSRISSLTTPSPVLAVLRQKHFCDKPDFSCLSVALDSVRDPGNFGTILRLCDWFGIRTVFASEDSVELYNPKVIQSTMGSVFREKVVFCDLPGLCRSYRDAGASVFGTFLGGESIYETALPGQGLIVMGNESRGISPEVARLVSKRLTIPSFALDGKGPESLNVGVATAVVLSEFRRKC